MKALKYALILLGALLILQPAMASVQPNAAATTETAAASASLTKKDLKTLTKEKKAELRAQKQEERRAKFLNWLSRMAADSNEQLIAAVLCFFLGGLGLHRVYLQSNPIIILWYLITLGGIFGLIPLIDFIRLLMGQVDHYKGNDNLFRAFQSS